MILHTDNEWDTTVLELTLYTIPPVYGICTVVLQRLSDSEQAPKCLGLNWPETPTTFTVCLLLLTITAISLTTHERSSQLESKQ